MEKEIKQVLPQEVTSLEEYEKLLNTQVISSDAKLIMLALPADEVKRMFTQLDKYWRDIMRKRIKHQEGSLRDKAISTRTKRITFTIMAAR
jgi:hypothetical protein